MPELTSPSVALRRIPYPYKAVLAICSDLDETPDRGVYWEIMRFLNTRETTSMGPGVGLEVANSIYFNEAPGQFSYWGTDDAGREMARTLIRSGHIDCLHSYGFLARARRDAQRALEELDKHGCRLQVWVDHASGPTNLGPDVTRGHGDEPGHPAYHSDLTIPYGIRYVWCGRVTSVIGQDIPFSLAGLCNPAHPWISAKTAAKDFAKHLLGSCGGPKYAMHGPNRVLRPAVLRDGQRVYEFMRSHPFWGGIGRCVTGRGIGQVLTDSMLKTLLRREGICVLYTHLGKIDSPAVPFDAAAVEGFRLLAKLQDQQELLVTTTSRLLRYLTVRDHLRFRSLDDGSAAAVTIDAVDDPIHGAFVPSVDDLQGLAFVKQKGSGPLRLSLAGQPCADLACSQDAANLWIPWRANVFPSGAFPA